MRAISLSFILFFLASCVIGRDYERPAIETPEKWLIDDSEFQQIATDRWWETFNDPVLNNLISKALESNKDLLIATARIEELAALYGVSRSELYPQITGTLGYERVATSTARIGFPIPLRNVFLTNLNLSWELDLWGRIQRLNESAEAQLLAEAANRKGVILSLITNVASAYIQLRGLDEELLVAKQTVGSRIGAREVAKARFDAGVTSELDVIQAEAELTNTEVTIPETEKRIKETEHLLSFLTGQNPSVINRGQTLSQYTLENAIPKALPSEIINQRPDIIRSEQVLVASNANLGAVKADYFPRISITGVFGYESSELSDLFTGNSKAWNFAPHADVPIFNYGRLSSRVDASEAQLEQALQTYLRTIQNAFKEVEDALVGFKKNYEQKKGRELQVKVLSRYLELAERLYKEGQTSYLEVLDSQRRLFDAKIAKTRADTEYLLSYINIFKALGGSWIEAAEKK